MANHNIEIEVDHGASDIREVSISAPSNSNKSKERQKREKIVKGKVIQKKPSMTKQITDTFFGEDVDNIREYVIFDVLIPAIKDTFFDVITGGLSMTLFGTGSKKSSKLTRDKGNSYVSYNSIYNSGKEKPREIDRSIRSMYNFDDIILESKGEAEEVLSNLVDLIDDYQIACVGDLYEFLGIPSEFTDHNYGWTNLSGASVKRVRNGYVLNLPKPKLIK